MSLPLFPNLCPLPVLAPPLKQKQQTSSQVLNYFRKGEEQSKAEKEKEGKKTERERERERERVGVFGS